VSEDRSERVTSVLDTDLSIKGPICTSLNDGFIFNHVDRDDCGNRTHYEEFEFGLVRST